jgi:2-isopropylmalate synthase
MSLKIESRPGPSTINVLTSAFETRLDPTKVQILDNTLREGEQPPGVAFTSDEKFAIAERLNELGVHWMSVGFPSVSEEERRTALRLTRAGFKMKTSALSRLLPSDIDATVDCGVDMVALFLGGSDTHLRDKLRMSEADAFKKTEEAVRRCKDRGALCAFCVEDASRTPLARMLRMFQVAADAGADLLVFADTCGVMTPTSTGKVISILHALLPVPISMHMHDDLGLALANTLAGLENGATLAQATVNGAGERSGNACLEELAVTLTLKYGLDLGLKLDRLTELCRCVHEASGTRPSEHKAVTGKWCFTHEAGIHVAGLLANQECYQPYPPDLVGRNHEIVFGKHSGMQSVKYLADTSAVDLSEAGRKSVLDRIKKEAEQHKRFIEVDEVLRWMREEK